jgi:isoleucyl-tRNA synthetase
MSKSKGNVVDPLEVAKKYGVDILRLWVVTADFKTDMRMSENILKQLSESYRKIRNTARYILGNLYDFDPNKDMVKTSDLEEIDRWALSKANGLISKVRGGYDVYDFHILYHAIHNFCVVDMSNFYLDVIKDRLYTSKANSAERRSAQTAIYKILGILVKLLAPVLCFTSEEIWKEMPHVESDNLYSIMFNDMPESCGCELLNDEALNEKYDLFLKVRSDVAKALEIARNDKIIGHSLNAHVALYADGATYDFLKANEADLATIFIVSNVSVEKGVDGEAYKAEETANLSIRVSVAEGEKCDRCWMFSKTVGSNSDHPTLCARCAEAISE